MPGIFTVSPEALNNMKKKMRTLFISRAIFITNFPSGDSQAETADPRGIEALVSFGEDDTPTSLA